MAGIDFNPGGPVIGIESPTEDLRERLALLIKYEGRLDARGITCALKEMPDASCLACPVSQADNPDDAKCALCRVGIGQELVSTTLIAKRIADQGHAD